MQVCSVTPLPSASDENVAIVGNVSPIDVYSHIPGLCEEHEIPYAFTPSREQLGLAAGHRRPAIVLLVRPHEDYQELYDEVSRLSVGVPSSPASSLMSAHLRSMKP